MVLKGSTDSKSNESLERQVIRHREFVVTLDAKSFLNFINNSPSPYHAVKEAIKLLERNGFKSLRNDEVKPGGKYYITRNHSSIIAFAVGMKFQKANGCHIIGAHTDSPCIKAKPSSNQGREGYIQVGVECYGGGLFHTWFDRDLGIAGRVMVRESDTVFRTKLVSIHRPILRVPSLAIHLDRDVSKGFLFNKETHLRPILATQIQAELEKTIPESSTSDQKHHPILLHLIAQELQISIDQIADFDLCLFDTQNANTGGALNEFIFSARLDNLCCSWLAIQSLIDSLDTLDSECNTRMIALFDNEEVGSDSRMGAGSDLLHSVMARIAGNVSMDTVSKSFILSADMAHAVHPNYAEKHEANHAPALHKGVVIKHNANQRYATTAESAFLFKEIARRHSIPVQQFVIRQDMACGSTIGPILSTRTGIRTLDVGIAQLSMHSIREMCGTKDLENGLKLFTHFFSEFQQVDQYLEKEICY